jgi:TolB-like protein/Flp pilus assembly protein TadD/tRNA A-37 threonylcarbamoyl transferase component Bud32
VDLSAGTKFGPYEILAPLGAGGMGEVYRAKDARLDRTVALKVLPEKFFEDEERKSRFEREAKLLAALNHPNIAVIYAFEEISGSSTSPRRHLLAMELLEGETLREKLGSPLPSKKAVEYAVQVAHGLAAAHEKGIVHRDIKPENLFVTKDGRIKILDFGVAKLTEPALSSVSVTEAPTAAPGTEAGVVMGTVGYMSPEQILGKPLDARSDLFSLGVVLYEMLSGKRPFKKDTAPETMAAILKEEPPQLSGTNQTVPPGLDRIVRHCLEKDPGNRFHSAKDVSFALETSSTEPTTGAGREPRHRLTRTGLAAAVVVALAAAALLWSRRPAPKPAPATPQPARIVVFPFENLGPPEDAYFAGGMTEEITSRLATVGGLSVISRTSARQYDRKGKTARDIGKDLGVTHVLDGSVRWDRGAGGVGRVRITPHLVRVFDDTQLWAQTFDRVMGDVFAIQSEIAEGVVSRMGVALEADTRASLRVQPTGNLDAYQAYLRGRNFTSQPHFSEAAWRGAVESYQRAVELDPRFVLAFAELSKAHARLYYLRADHSSERRNLALAALRRAQELSPDAPEVHLAAGFCRFWAERDPDSALKEFAMAESARPGGADAVDARAEALRMTGRWKEALEQYRRAAEMSPQDAHIATELALTASWLRRFDEALAAANQAIALAPDMAWPYLAKAFNYWTWNRGSNEGRATLASVPAGHEWALWAWFWQEMLDGRPREALRRLEAARQDWIRQKMWAMPKSLLAGLAHEALGEREAARAAFEAARPLLEAEVAKHPDDARLRSSLGIAYAGLGRKEDAIREGLRATDLLPLEKDAMYGFPHLNDLFVIYAMTGRDDDAFRTLETMLSVPSFVSRSWLEGIPQWTRLRKDSRFTALVAKHDGKP